MEEERTRERLLSIGICFGINSNAKAVPLENVVKEMKLEDDLKRSKRRNTGKN